MDTWAVIAAERTALADTLGTLDDAQWATPSLCGAWTVRDVAAHLVVPQTITAPRFLLTLARSGGSFERANVAMTAREAAHPTAEIVASIRRFAGSRRTPPGFGPEAPLTDLLVHGQDIRIPLSLPDERPAAQWGAVLDFVVHPKARRGFVSKALPNVRFAATDLGWSHGTGNEVRGPARALALTILGRPALSGGLVGPGADTLRDWL